ncbi:hypothetical protein J7K25_07770 [bacterium]|nr:hypothetical protein [bacterium]
MEGYRNLLKKVRKKVRQVNPDAILTSEANTEPFIDLLDGNLAITPTFSKEVPLYKVVYGDYTIVYGRKPSPSMLREKIPFDAMLALSFVNGEQIGWFSVGRVVKLLMSEDFKTQAEYMRKIIRGLKLAKEFLIEGIYQRPLNLEFPDGIKNIEFKTILAGYKYRFKLPPVLNGVYKSYKGELCIVLTNYSNEKQKVRFKIDLSKYGIKAHRMKVWIDGKVRKKKISESFEVTEEIQPKSIEIYIIQ